MTKKVKRKLKAKNRPAPPMPPEVKTSTEISFCKFCDSYTDHENEICQRCGASDLDDAK